MTTWYLTEANVEVLETNFNHTDTCYVSMKCVTRLNRVKSFIANNSLLANYQKYTRVHFKFISCIYNTLQGLFYLKFIFLSFT